MTQVPPPICTTCRHFRPKTWDCNAFPGQKIPDAIVEGSHTHKEPYPGDHGIQYEPIDEEEE